VADIKLADAKEAKDIIGAMRAECHLSLRTIARSTGVSLRRIRLAARYNTIDDAVKARLLDLQVVCLLALQEIKPYFIPTWLENGVPALGGNAPADYIRDGKAKEVEELLRELIGGSFS